MNIIANPVETRFYLGDMRLLPELLVLALTALLGTFALVGATKC